MSACTCGRKACWYACQPLEPRDRDDIARAVAAGLPEGAAAALAYGRAEWRRLEEEGPPEGWPPDTASHYFLFPISQNDDHLNRMRWALTETAAQHQAAPVFDELWVRQFRVARGLPRRGLIGARPRDGAHLAVAVYADEQVASARRRRGCSLGGGWEDDPRIEEIIRQAVEDRDRRLEAGGGAGPM